MNTQQYTLIKILFLTLMTAVTSCSGSGKTRPASNAEGLNDAQSEFALLTRPDDFLVGADLSYVNEMEVCGAVYRWNGIVKDPYALFAEAGSDLVRVRLWHNPQWTNYSNLEDVSETVRRAQASGQKVLLDLHYSDTWADPQKQYIPAAWEHLFGDDEALAEAVYRYTFEVLEHMRVAGHVPEFIQIGNETNVELLQLETQMNTEQIDWPRNIKFFNQGLQAVADFNSLHGQQVLSFIHIAQPENALRWFPQAREAGLQDFDYIGISYYKKWSSHSMEDLAVAISQLVMDHAKPVVVVEASYPWTLQNFDQANNILGEDSLVEGYPATPEGQRKYFEDMLGAIVKGGGSGLVYWEPAWVSTACSTLWGQGSHWENAALFDNEGEALPAMNIYRFGRD